MELKQSIFVYTEVEEGTLTKLSVELLGKARELAQSCSKAVVALVIGEHVREAAGQAIGYGADAAVVAEGPQFAVFDSILYARAVQQVIAAYTPSVFLLGATKDSRDIGGRVSAALQLGLVADVTGAEMKDGDDTVTWIRPAYTGKVFAAIRTKTRPQLATVGEGIFLHNASDPSRKGDIITAPLSLDGVTGKRRRTGFTAVAPEKMALSLENAEIIVGAGKGVGDKAGMEQVQAFAERIGAGFGVTKPLVDDGWISHDSQIGITGKKVAPKIYIALGISGALQHKLGIKDAKIIVAVNKDPDAPIFKFAHFGIVGDLFEAMPALEKRIKALQA